MNHVQLIGRLGRDAERAGSAEDVLAILNLATNERWTDKAGQDVEHTEWHRLVCKGRLAQWALSTLGKGAEVFVEGRLRSTRWTGRDGSQRRGFEILVDELKVISGAPRRDRVVLAAKGLSSIEKLLRDRASGRRRDVSLADLSGMLGSVRESLEQEAADARL
ncbi:MULTISPECIES: single-stranded DNA-binding protein [unclassified Variovorax]|uniref:single-stranded DNA-binding protein n=1 Tax=unclassified Variovorax TaxID=663243 RepID=UPI003ECDF324